MRSGEGLRGGQLPGQHQRRAEPGLDLQGVVYRVCLQPFELDTAPLRNSPVMRLCGLPRLQGRQQPDRHVHVWAAPGLRVLGEHRQSSPTAGGDVVPSAAAAERPALDLEGNLLVESAC